MEYNVDYFIKKFEEIPENQWSVGDFRTIIKNGLGNIKSTTWCAQGHCMPKEHYDTIINMIKDHGLLQVSKSYSEWSSLINIFGRYMVYPEYDKKWKIVDTRKSLIVAMINNGNDKNYLQPTAKQRILKALYDMKAGTYPYKEKITEEVKIIKEELILN